MLRYLGWVGRATLCTALAGAAFAAPGETAAHASVAIAVSWEGLLEESSAAVIVTALEARAVWEDGRIYTYTHVRVDRSVAGELTLGGDAWVRTMGGIVGKIGQVVEGEAALIAGRSSLLFLHPGPVGAFEVTARAQGQFPVVSNDPKLPPYVVRGHAAGLIVRNAGNLAGRSNVLLAGELLHGRSVDDAAREVTSAWNRTHAP